MIIYFIDHKLGMQLVKHTYLWVYNVESKFLHDD